MRSDESARSKERNARRGSVGAGQEQSLSIQLDRMLAPLMKRFQLVAEKVEVMNGDRQNARAKAVIREEGLAPLRDIGRGTARKAAGANPTKEEFDLLVDDVRAIREALNAIAAQLNDL